MNNPILYSPAENHLAVIYTDRYGRKRFKRFVNEHEQIMLNPRRFTRLYLLKEVNLGPRTAHIFLSNVFTIDRVLLDLELKVFYRFDPRSATRENLIRVINSHDKAFEGMIRTNIEKIVRNIVFIQKTSEYLLFSHAGRRELQKVLSVRISERVETSGIAIDHSFGVAVMNLLPTNNYMNALMNEAAATSQGRAVSKRIAASMQNIDEINLAQSNQILNTHIASAITETGTIPQHLYTYNTVENQTPEEGFHRRENTPGKPKPKTPKIKRNYPVAAD